MNRAGGPALRFICGQRHVELRAARANGGASGERFAAGQKLGLVAMGCAGERRALGY